MREEKKQTKVEKSEKKTILIFIAILICCCLGGFLSGFVSALVEDKGGFDWIRSNLGEFLAPACMVLYYVCNIVMCIVTALYVLKVKNSYHNYQNDEEDELLLDHLEDVMNYPTLVTNIWMLLNVFFGSAVFEVINFTEFGIKHQNMYLIIYLAILAASYTICILTQNDMVKLTQSLNPEKRGSIFDFKFNKVWESSCDEAQKQIIYRSGHAGFKNVNIACMVCWMISFVLQYVLRTGIYPILFISIIWFVNVISYTVKGMQLEKHSN